MKLDLPHSVVIEFPAGARDGEVLYTRLPAQALAALEKCVGANGEVDDRSVFIIQCAEPPRIGCRVIHNNVTYELRGVKPCTDLDGRITAYRCSV